MSQKLNAAIAVIGIDIGKNSFHVVGLDRSGAIVLRQKWSRGQVEAQFANMLPCLVGMEAFSARGSRSFGIGCKSAAADLGRFWDDAGPGGIFCRTGNRTCCIDR